MAPDLNSYASIPATGRVGCPLAENPRPECYCFEMSSLDIPDLQYFCGRNHRQCGIYREILRANEPEQMYPPIRGRVRYPGTTGQNMSSPQRTAMSIFPRVSAVKNCSRE